MRIPHTISAALTVLLLVFLFKQSTSKITQPPAGNTGGPPTNKTCAQCHSGAAVQPDNAALSFIFTEGGQSVDVDAFSYEPGKIYNVQFVPGIVSKRYGFQLSALNNSGQNAGSFTITDNTHTSLITSSQNFIGHKNASGYKNWTFDWSAPATDIGAVTFYYAYVNSDSASDDNNDTVYAGTKTIFAAPSNITTESYAFNLSLAPIPAHNFISVITDVELASSVSAYDYKGRVYNLNLTDGLLNTEELQSGIYILQFLDLQGNTIIRKVVIQ